MINGPRYLSHLASSEGKRWSIVWSGRRFRCMYLYDRLTGHAEGKSMEVGLWSGWSLGLSCGPRQSHIELYDEKVQAAHTCPDVSHCMSTSSGCIPRSTTGCFLRVCLVFLAKRVAVT